MGTTKLLIRPVKMADLDAICEVATLLGPGFNSLPKDPNAISAKIKRSLETFSSHQTEQGIYFFVLEENDKVIGTSAVELDINHNNPFYCYLLTHVVQQSHALKEPITQSNKVLLLVNHFPKASLFCTLYLNPNYRGQGRGTFLSRARALFIAEFPDSFSQMLVADMQGVYDANGISPFWNAVSQHFYEMDFATANKNYAMYGSQFISDLNPHYPIYVAMLPNEAQEVLGKPHAGTKPAVHVLEKEGFMQRENYSIFDGGPILEVRKNELNTVKHSLKVQVIGLKKKCENSEIKMICNTKKVDFRATLGVIDFGAGQENNKVFLEEALALQLNVSVGDFIRMISFR